MLILKLSGNELRYIFLKSIQSVVWLLSKFCILHSCYAVEFYFLSERIERKNIQYCLKLDQKNNYVCVLTIFFRNILVEKIIINQVKLVKFDCKF